MEGLSRHLHEQSSIKLHSKLKPLVRKKFSGIREAVLGAGREQQKKG